MLSLKGLLAEPWPVRKLLLWLSFWLCACLVCPNLQAEQSSVSQFRLLLKALHVQLLTKDLLRPSECAQTSVRVKREEIASRLLVVIGAEFDSLRFFLLTGHQPSTTAHHHLDHHFREMTRILSICITQARAQGLDLACHKDITDHQCTQVLLDITRVQGLKECRRVLLCRASHQAFWDRRTRAACLCKDSKAVLLWHHQALVALTMPLEFKDIWWTCQEIIIVLRGRSTSRCLVNDSRIWIMSLFRTRLISMTITILIKLCITSSQQITLVVRTFKNCCSLMWWFVAVQHWIIVASMLSRGKNCRATPPLKSSPYIYFQLMPSSRAIHPINFALWCFNCFAVEACSE